MTRVLRLGAGLPAQLKAGASAIWAALPKLLN